MSCLGIIIIRVKNLLLLTLITFIPLITLLTKTRIKAAVRPEGVISLFFIVLK